MEILGWILSNILILGGAFALWYYIPLLDRFRMAVGITESVIEEMKGANPTDETIVYKELIRDEFTKDVKKYTWAVRLSFTVLLLGLSLVAAILLF